MCLKNIMKWKKKPIHASDLRPLVVVLKIKTFHNKKLAEQSHKPVIR